MCIAAPGRVTKIKGREVEVEYPGIQEKRRAMVGGEKVKEGDVVMVQMGIVVRVLGEEEADEVVKAWNDQ